MKHYLATVIVTTAALLGSAATADAACTYFAALDQDVNQPGQRAFITWDPVEKIEAFTVQPKFEGNAEDFGMVIPTPSRPKLKEAPREIFKDLALFTVLKPTPCTRPMPSRRFSKKKSSKRPSTTPRPTVKVLEAGTVGTLDYKIIKASDAGDLYGWLKDNNYSFASGKDTLEFYVKKNWIFTVMKIDPSAMKKGPGGVYTGQISPTRFQFSSKKLIYPLRITQSSVKTTTNALLYVMTKSKVAIPGGKVEFAKRLKPADIKRVGAGTVAIPKPMRQKVAQTHDFKGLKGWLEGGMYLTKVRRIYNKAEMTDDLIIKKAKDNKEYTTYEDCGGVPP